MPVGSTVKRRAHQKMRSEAHSEEMILEHPLASCNDVRNGIGSSEFTYLGNKPLEGSLA